MHWFSGYDKGFFLCTSTKAVALFGIFTNQHTEPIGRRVAFAIFLCFPIYGGGRTEQSGLKLPRTEKPGRRTLHLRALSLSRCLAHRSHDTLIFDSIPSIFRGFNFSKLLQGRERKRPRENATPLILNCCLLHATQNQMRPGEVALPPLSPKACIVPSIISGRDTLPRVYEMFSLSSTRLCN